MIRLDQVWLATEPLDMRAGADTALACVVKRFGKAQPHTAYVFLNKRANRMKVLVHDGFGVWLAARRLHKGKFVQAIAWQTDKRLELNVEQLNALVVGLPWHYLGKNQAIEVA